MHQNNATILALAWPDTKVTHEGKWYDYPMKWVGAIDKEGYYNAGHAALILIIIVMEMLTILILAGIIRL